MRQGAWGDPIKCSLERQQAGGRQRRRAPLRLCCGGAWLRLVASHLIACPLQRKMPLAPCLEGLK